MVAAINDLFHFGHAGVKAVTTLRAEACPGKKRVANTIPEFLQETDCQPPKPADEVFSVNEEMMRKVLAASSSVASRSASAPLPTAIPPLEKPAPNGKDAKDEKKKSDKDEKEEKPCEKCGLFHQPADPRAPCMRLPGVRIHDDTPPPPPPEKVSQEIWSMCVACEAPLPMPGGVVILGGKHFCFDCAQKRQKKAENKSASASASASSAEGKDKLSLVRSSGGAPGGAEPPTGKKLKITTDPFGDQSVDIFELAHMDGVTEIQSIVDRLTKDTRQMAGTSERLASVLNNPAFTKLKKLLKTPVSEIERLSAQMQIATTAIEQVCAIELAQMTAPRRPADAFGFGLEGPPVSTIDEAAPLAVPLTAAEEADIEMQHARPAEPVAETLKKEN